MLATAQQRSHGRHELRVGLALHQVAARARPQCTLRVQHLKVHRHDEDRQLGPSVVYATDEVDAAAVAEGDVGDDEVRCGLDDARETVRYAARFTADGEVRLGLQQRPVSPTHEGVVVHDEQTTTHSESR